MNMRYQNEKSKRNLILMNKLVYLCLSILNLSKTVMYDFWYDYIKPKYGKYFAKWIQTASLFI